MPIQPTTTATTSATAAASTKTATPNALGKDDFLKLMVAQMAQFSSLEQITNLATATQDLANKMSLTQNIGLLGHTVTYTGGDGTAVTGTVDGLQIAKDGKTSLSVAGQAGVDPTAVTSVR